MTLQQGEMSGYSVLPEPELVFAGNRTHKHPLLGLINHGPYGLKFGTPSKVRFALMAPKGDLSRLKNLVAELERKASPREAKNYYPEYPGFSTLFRVPLAPLDDKLIIPFDDELNVHAQKGAKLDLARNLFQNIYRSLGPCVRASTWRLSIFRRFGQNVLRARTSIFTIISRRIVLSPICRSRS